MKQVAPLTGQKANELLQSISKLLDARCKQEATPYRSEPGHFPIFTTLRPWNQAQYVTQVKRAVSMLAKAGVPFSNNLVLD